MITDLRTYSEELLELQKQIDGAMASYMGEPITLVVARNPIGLRAIHDAISNYRDLGWTVEYEIEPLRLTVC